MDICFTSIQNLLVLKNHPLYTINEYTINVIKKFYKDNFLMNNIILIKNYGFGIEEANDIKQDFHIEEDPITLRSLLSVKTYVKNYKFLRTHNIRYLD